MESHDDMHHGMHSGMHHDMHVRHASVMWRVRLAASVLWASVWSSACEPDPCALTTEPPTVQLGTGTTTFIPLDDGDTVPYARGPQGGTHIDGALRIAGMVYQASRAPLDGIMLGDLPQVAMRTTENGTAVGGFSTRPMAFAPVSATSPDGVVVGVQVIFEEDASVHVGKSLELSADVIDRCGASASSSRMFLLGDDT